MRPSPVLAACLALLALALPGVAQQEPSDAAAKEIARIALIDLRAQERPTGDDLLIAADLLALASEFRPGDAQLIRRRIEALQNAGDDAGVIAATRELVRADPSDTVAQLRLLSWTVGLRQTVDERLDAYAKLVGERASGVIDASVRSRLAFDAALLARESGRDELFERMLDLALELDPSHKEAAALAVAVRLPGASSGVERLRLLSGLLMADPIDPNTHFSIADELTNAGAFGQALRFHTLGARLLEIAGESLTTTMVEQRVALRWYVEGPETILEEVESQLLSAREQARKQIERLERLGEPTDEILTPDEIRLDPTRDQFRVLSALAEGRKASAINALGDLQRTISQEFESLEERMGEFSDDPEEARRQFDLTVSQTSAQLVSLTLLVGEQTSAMRTQVAVLRDAGNLPESVITVLEGLLLLRAGQPGAAIDRFERYEDRSTLAKLAQGIAYEQLGLEEQAAGHYLDAARSDPLRPFGAYSAALYERLAGSAPTLRDDTELIAQIAAKGLPVWLDAMIDDPTTFMTLRFELPEPTIGGLEPSRVRLIVRNTSPIPLALGPDRTISSRFLLSPLVEIDAVRIRGTLDPEVIDLSHRLRLRPREDLVVELDPSPATLGFIMDVRCSRRVRARWRVLQGFKIGQDRSFVPGGLSLGGQTPSLVRTPVALARGDAETIGRSLAVSEGPQLCEALGVLRSVTTDPARGGAELTGEQLAILPQIVGQRFPLFERAERFVAVACVPPIARAPSSQPFEDAVWAEPDNELRMLMLITRVTDPDHPQLELAKQSEDPRLAAFANRLEARLERTDAGFAKVNRGSQSESP